MSNFWIITPDVIVQKTLYPLPSRRRMGQMRTAMPNLILLLLATVLLLGKSAAKPKEFYIGKQTLWLCTVLL